MPDGRQPGHDGVGHHRAGQAARGREHARVVVEARHGEHGGGARQSDGVGRHGHGRGRVRPGGLADGARHRAAAVLGLDVDEVRRAVEAGARVRPLAVGVAHAQHRAAAADLPAVRAAYGIGAQAEGGGELAHPVLRDAVGAEALGRGAVRARGERAVQRDGTAPPGAGRHVGGPDDGAARRRCLQHRRLAAAAAAPGDLRAARGEHQQHRGAAGTAPVPPVPVVMSSSPSSSAEPAPGASTSTGADPVPLGRQVVSAPVRPSRSCGPACPRARSTTPCASA